MRMRSAVLVLACLAPGAAVAQVTASRPWVRAPAPGQNIAAAYVALTSQSADALTGVEASGAGMAMLHHSATAGGKSSMTDIDKIGLPAGRTVTLKPGGYHIMLMDMKPAPAVGGSVTLTLHFAHAKDLVVQAPVRPLTASGP